MRSRIPLFAFLLVAGSLALPVAAHAGIPFFGPIIPEATKQCALSWGALVTVINNIIQLLITLAVVFVAPLMIAWAGFLYVVNPVDPSGIKKAKDILIHTIVGIVVALAGWMIVDALMLALYNPDTPIAGGKLGAWSQLVTSGGLGPCIDLAGSLSQTTTTPAVTVAPVSSGKLNVAAATAYLDANAVTSSSGGMCALYVRKALSAGGLTSFDANHPGYAYQYGSYLTNAGFNTVSSGGYSPQAGDVVVFQPVTGHTFGHIEMYDGRQWVSDFKQRDFYPAAAYQGGSYAIYRQ